MREVLPILDETLSDGRSLALSMVVDRRGSLPMARCAKMVVLEDGSTRGTVGGGCLEAEVWAVGRSLLDDGGCSLDTFHLNEVEEGLGGHVCGGTVSILSRVLRPTDRTREMVVGLREAIEHEHRVGLVTALPEARGRGRDRGWALLHEGGALSDGLELDDTTIERCRAGITRDQPSRMPLARGELFLEPLPPDPVALVFGAGHCGRAIGEAASRAGFRVRVYDDRAPFCDPGAMPWAETVARLDFTGLDAALDVRPHHYLVIVTRGHEHDLALLRQLAGAPAAYLGMIGSRRKRALFERSLRAEGVEEATLDRLRSPMGLPIGADTPEEIAVAVVGEMIAVRRGAGTTSGS